MQMQCNASPLLEILDQCRPMNSLTTTCMIGQMTRDSASHFIPSCLIGKIMRPPASFSLQYRMWHFSKKWWYHHRCLIGESLKPPAFVGPKTFHKTLVRKSRTPPSLSFLSHLMREPMEPSAFLLLQRGFSSAILKSNCNFLGGVLCMPPAACLELAFLLLAFMCCSSRDAVPSSTRISHDNRKAFGRGIST